MSLNTDDDKARAYALGRASIWRDDSTCPYDAGSELADWWRDGRRAARAEERYDWQSCRRRSMD